MEAAMPRHNDDWKRSLAEFRADNRSEMVEIAERVRKLLSDTTAEPLPERLRALLNELERKLSTDSFRIEMIDGQQRFSTWLIRTLLCSHSISVASPRPLAQGRGCRLLHNVKLIGAIKHDVVV
jgi:hypothetical protein